MILVSLGSIPAPTYCFSHTIPMLDAARLHMVWPLSILTA